MLSTSFGWLERKLCENQRSIDGSTCGSSPFAWIAAIRSIHMARGLCMVVSQSHQGSDPVRVTDGE